MSPILPFVHRVHNTWGLKQTLVIARPQINDGKPQNFCMDAGYIGHQDEAELRNYTAHIRPRGEKKKEVEHNPDFHARR